MKGSSAVALRHDDYFPFWLNVDRARRPLIFRRRIVGKLWRRGENLSRRVNEAIILRFLSELVILFCYAQ